MAPSDLASSASSLLPAAQPTVIQQLEQLLTDAHRLEASAASPPSSPSSSSDYLHGPTRIENVHDQSSVAVMSILIAICGFAVFFLLADLVRRAHAHNKTSLTPRPSHPHSCSPISSPNYSRTSTASAASRRSRPTRSMPRAATRGATRSSRGWSRPSSSLTSTR